MKRSRQQHGFSLIELLVVMTIILVLTYIGLQSYTVFVLNGQDNERMLNLNKFAQKIEQYKNEVGYYPCGDSCTMDASNKWWSWDCSDQNITAAGITRENQSQHAGFLNGGNCCNFAPYNAVVSVPTTTDDDRIYGLYAYNFLATNTPKDPIERQVNSLKYSYCYGTPADGRQTYDLFARLQHSKKGTIDNGICDGLYEVTGPDYPSNGWAPTGWPNTACW